MGLSTFSIGAAVTPTVIETWCSHYINRRPRKQKPVAHISYDLGLNLIKQFLAFAFKNTIDDLQAFTSQKVICPPWVRTEDVDISHSHILEAAHCLQIELGPDGLYAIGGATWWQWRHKDHKLQAEWIEMRKDYDLRELRDGECMRSMLYVHGGAYYFGSVDTHRYQLQRHARKLQARIFAPRYRLAPQYPFPCGLLDCLAAYLHLLTLQRPETIVLAGDSSGGGMVLSMLVILRSQGLPLPAGAVLLSPWVDLTHSFPSCSGTTRLDYVPDSGFVHAPSATWPPPDTEQLRSLDGVLVETEQGKKSAGQLRKEAETRSAAAKKASVPADGSKVPNGNAQTTMTTTSAVQIQKTMPGAMTNLAVEVDGSIVEIQDQIQMYAPNHLLAHPLVSPVMQASLGGLPPLCILVGGSEMLRDEQIYLAHKAADPASYPPPVSDSEDLERVRSEIDRWAPTYVQLQIWDDLCHVAPTLSFTRPAKHMFRSVAQFSAWALARAQRSEIRILDDDEVSNISSDSEEDLIEEFRPGSRRDSMFSKSSKRGDPKYVGDLSLPGKPPPERQSRRSDAPTTVGKAGDPIPAFKAHMIRHRVTRHGDLYALESPSDLVACTIDPREIGSIKSGPVRKWHAAQERLNVSHGVQKKHFQAKRLDEIAETMGGKGAVFTQGQINSLLIGHEQPPPTAWAGMSKVQIAQTLKTRNKRKVSKGLAMWSGWGSKHDEEAINAELEKIDNKEDVVMSVTCVRLKTQPSTDMLGGTGGAGGAWNSGFVAATAPDRPPQLPPTDHKPVTPIKTERSNIPLQPYSTPHADALGDSELFPGLKSTRGASLASTLTTLTVPLVLSPEMARPPSPPGPDTQMKTQPTPPPRIGSPVHNGQTSPVSSEFDSRTRSGRKVLPAKEEDSPIQDSTTLPSGDKVYRSSHRRVYSSQNNADIPPTPTIPANFRVAPTPQFQSREQQEPIGVVSTHDYGNDHPRDSQPPQIGDNSPILGTDTPSRAISPSSEIYDDEGDVQVVAAQAVPIITPEAARREHARKSSVPYTFGRDPAFRSGARPVSVGGPGTGDALTSEDIPDLPHKSIGGLGNRRVHRMISRRSPTASIDHAYAKTLDMESWADRVVDEVRTIGSRDGRPPSRSSHVRAKSG